MRQKLQLLLIFLLTSFAISAQKEIPQRPNPVRFVNDYAKIFSVEQQNQLEEFLEMVDDSTSNQISIVTVNSLNGYTPAEYATELGQKWGVGGKRFDNGIVVLIKPQTTNEKGETFIAVGYGLEGAIPDAFCHQIIQEEMIPNFRTNNYYAGVSVAVNTLYKAAKGEINVKRPLSKGGDLYTTLLWIFLLGFPIAIPLYLWFKRKHPDWFISNSNDTRHTTYGGGYFFGGFGGGYGGSQGNDFGGSFSSHDFGGGSFGGGGAGGSW